MRILQLTDIHIGGDYDGKFKCKLNFLSTLRNAIDTMEPYDLIVITGDLADKDYRENYEWIKSILELTNVPFFVLPGNHDDVQEMRTVFGENTVGECDYCIKDSIMFWNNRLDANPLPDTIDTPIKTVFCHYPVYTVPHKFMEAHALPNAMELGDKLKAFGVTNVFCGHFHWELNTVNEKLHVHVIPSTQCQLDPYTPECKPTDDWPAFASIAFDDKQNVYAWATFTVDPLYMLRDILACSDNIKDTVNVLLSSVRALRFVSSNIGQSENKDWCPWDLSNIMRMKTIVLDMRDLIDAVKSKKENIL